MSELLRPIFQETDDTNELQRQREMASAYLGEVSVVLCNANAEYHDIIDTVIQLNMKLRARGIHE